MNEIFEPRPKNFKWKRLTVERVKKEKGLENLTDEEANEVIDILEQYSIIMFNLWQKKTSTWRRRIVYFNQFIKSVSISLLMPCPSGYSLYAGFMFNDFK